MRLEIRIAGFGGQGIGLASYILGKALALYEDLEVVMTQAYGPEARGGASSADLVVSDEQVDYPFIHQADILVTMSQEAFIKFRPKTKSNATIIIDADLVETHDNDGLYAVPATQIAEGIGNRITANMVMLGFFSALTGLVTQQSVDKAIGDTLSPKIIALNQQAFSRGFEYARDEAIIDENINLATLRGS